MRLGGTESADGAIAALHEAATEATGLSSFGDGYLDGLARLVEEFLGQDEDELARYGRGSANAFRSLTNPLCERLRSEEAWRQSPAVLDDRVPAPVVITGLPRTGTTALHQLLAMDERFQVLENWILHCPMPRPPRDLWPEVPCYQAALARFNNRPEEERRYHWVEPHDADECLLIMAQSFASNLFGEVFLLPEYDEWFLAADMTPSFSRYADQLRLIGAGDERRWLLKNPSHIFSLDELFVVFPDALVIQTHRPLLAAMGSQVSMMSIVAPTDPLRRAEREIRMWAEATRRADAARAGREDRFCDVDYRDLVSNPIGVVDTIYSRLDLELHPDTRRTMQRWLAANPQDKHGKHVYDPAELGVTAEAIEENFGDYIYAHGLSDAHPRTNRSASRSVDR